MKILVYIGLVIAPYLLCLWTRKAFLGYTDDAYKNNMIVK